MKKKAFYYTLIILFTAFPIVVDTILTNEANKHYPRIWSLFLIPSTLITYTNPKWKVVIGASIFFTLLKFATEFAQETSTDTSVMTLLTFESFINWSIALTIGYFVIKASKLLEKVEELTITDALTGINNRRYFDFFVEKTIPIHNKKNDPLTLMLIDIDHFKKINDNYGHRCGDEALKYVSSIIGSNVRNSDAFARFGGEEFAVIMPNTDIAEGLEIAGIIREAVEKSDFTYNNKRIHFTISIGVSFYNGEEMEKFIEKADQALYKAKENGRNQIAIVS